MRFRSRYSIKTILTAGLIVILLQVITQLLFNVSGNSYDHKATDVIYSFAYKNGATPAASNRVVFLTINDQTYDWLKSNQLDRKFLAKAIDDLSSYSPEAVMFDILFARPSSPVADSIFAESLRSAGNICLPAGLSVSFENKGGMDKEGVYYNRLVNEFLIHPRESGEGQPFIAGRGLYQADIFAGVTSTSGHITAVSESDGVYRFYPMLIKVDSGYLPTSTLAMFLKMYDITPDSIYVKWGESITIPALKESKLEKDVVIPIDKHGQTFIPYPSKWQDDKRKMEIKNFTGRAENPELTDELTAFFEGNVVFVGDVSTGISDTGPTTLDIAAPLVVIHAAIMNALMTDSFFRSFGIFTFLLVITGVTVLMTVMSTLKNGIFLHFFFIAALLLSLPFAYLMIAERILFPVVTFQAFTVLGYLSLLLTIQYTSAKEQSFIKSAFSRYLSPSVVDRLIENRESLALGGEERELTVLFSDIAGFTTISETIKPQELVKLLNEYFTEMTSIVTTNGGIIDKYIGDAIMAEFGAPLAFDGHALAAVNSALQMQRRCDDLNRIWKEKGHPEIRMRVGINTGGVILGNMGSQQVFDYTVVGDTVNLASRLEGAGKVYGCNIMISETVYDQIKTAGIKTRALDFIKVKGKNKAVKVFEVISDEVYEKESVYFLKFEEALGNYFAQQFESAAALFRECLDLKPGDAASKEFLKRIKYFTENEVPSDWDGSFQMKEK
ncbi:MAG: adenylate/guanylate cyclase domain-containing protein [Bacteroidetes bacterium]|nr:adenylate/guanylate cyclase domain-containing protein [Bacteroidota bacterium]